METLEIQFPDLLKFRGRQDIRSMTLIEHGYRLQFEQIAPMPLPEPPPAPPKPTPPIKVAVIEPQTVIQPVLVTCPSCKAEHEQGSDCSICTKLNRIRIKARDNRRSYAVQKQNERDVRMPCKD